jgi:ABC-type sugar transport system permease subunit
VLFSSALQGVDEALYEAAKIDGCTIFGQFKNVTLPCIRNTMTTVIIMMVIYSFQVYDLVFTMTNGGPGYSSYVMSYYVWYEGFIANHTGYATALSIILTIILLIASKSILNVRERKDA